MVIVVKSSHAVQETQRGQLDPCVRKIHWRRKWQLTPVFLPGEFHRQRGLVSYSPWDTKELYTTEHTHTHTILKFTLKLHFYYKYLKIQQQTLGIFSNVRRCYFFNFILYVSLDIWVLKPKVENMLICLHKKKIVNFKNKTALMNIF